jgi:cytochrome c oxidase cbb3-type subunit 3
MALLLAGACEREARRYQELPAAANRETSVRVGQLEPGGPQQTAAVKSPYQDNAWGIGEGKRLYGAFNCAPCHGVNGGGAIGPPLMDDKWIYGSRPEQIFATISQGRPDGMPSFGGHIPTQQIWQLVAYVQSMSGQVSALNAAGRNDDQATGPPESRRPPQVPVQTGHR